MILEGLVTTTDPDGSPHLAPLGPTVDEQFRHLVLRPFPSSHTGQNLLRTGAGVLHVSDDVELLARAAIHQWDEPPAMIPLEGQGLWRLADCCRWYVFRITQVEATEPRLTLQADVTEQGQLREFFGFNRAKHAVVEAAILATRTEWLTPDYLRAELARLAPWVEKTGGPVEQRSWRLLVDHVERALTQARPPAIEPRG